MREKERVTAKQTELTADTAQFSEIIIDVSKFNAGLNRLIDRRLLNYENKIEKAHCLSHKPAISVRMAHAQKRVTQALQQINPSPYLNLNKVLAHVEFAPGRSSYWLRQVQF